MSRKINFEQALQNYYQQAEPDPLFVEELGSRLAREPRLMQPKPRRLNWAWSLALVAACLVGSVLWIGPQRVWAAVLGMVGYIPGVGFVQTDNAMALSAPVESQLDGMTLRVETLVAGPDKTTLVIRTLNVPQSAKDWMYTITLRLPNTTEAVPNSYATLSSDSGQTQQVLVYPRLPKGTREVTLVWRLMKNPADKEVTRWEIPLELQPVSLYSNVYQPKLQSATQNGITLDIEQVSDSSEITGIRLGLTVPGTNMHAMLPDGEALRLSDDQGRTYAGKSTPIFQDIATTLVTLTPSAPGGQAYQRFYATYEFAPLDPNAKRITLTATQVNLLGFPHAVIPVDLGNTPKIGDKFPVQASIDTGEYKIPVTAVRVIALDWKGQTVPGLVLEFGPLPTGITGIEQVSVNTGTQADMISDLASGCVAQVWPQGLPKGIIELRVDQLLLTIKGEWKLEWTRPGK